ncbi:MAG: AIPR family protein [Candidatus Omnitrophota bacterium]|jgi:hypothetical protein
MQGQSARQREVVHFPFYNVRNISCPDDNNNCRKIYVGHAPVSSIIDIPTDEDVRGYLIGAEGKKKKVPSQVHRAIRSTISDNPENFSVLNGGVVIVARECTIDENEKTLLLKNPSIINGAQTQGIVSDFFKDNSEELKAQEFSCHVKFEIVVTNDDDLIAEISIARNFQNDVMTLSIVGRRGYLDELEQSFQVKSPGTQLQKSETKLSEDYIKTERLLQVIAALIPEELWVKKEDINKVYTYSMKAKCLKEFQEIYLKAKKKEDPEHHKYLELYQFYLDISAIAWELYSKWKTHQGFAGTGLHSIKREGSTIKEVPDGIVFPILAALSVFAKKTNEGWTIKLPNSFSEKELIKSVKSIYQEIADRNPNVMGKKKACYSSLIQITSIYKRLSK